MTVLNAENEASKSQKNHTPSLARQEKIAISLHEVSLEVVKKKGIIDFFKKRPNIKQRLLDDVNCEFKHGRLTAIMGPSGAGKTSLLKAISGDNSPSSQLFGSILVNNEPYTPKDVKSLSSFVFQDDVLYPTMTSKEAISMAAELKNKAVPVSTILKLLGLEKAADTSIGDPSKKGLSGGEKKRVSIGMSLVSDPKLLFLDEPTSGLDLGTACTVIEYLKCLASQGRTIITTIHQPCSQIYHMIDDLILLANGKIIYEGDAKDAVGYFTRLGFPCPEFTNPADYLFLNVILPENLKMLQEAWIHEKGTKYNPPEIQEISKPEMIKTAPFFTQFKFLTTRAFKNLFRNRMILQLKLIRAVFFGLLIASVYRSSKNETNNVDALIQNRISCLYNLLTNEFFGGVAAVISVYTIENPVFLREYRQGYYSVISYFLSKMIVELPFLIIFPVSTLSIAYWIVGFRSDTVAFLIACLIMIIVALCSSAMGMFLGGLFSRIEAALAAMPMILMPMIVFGGLLVNLSTVPIYFRWIKHISPVKRAFVALSRNEFEHDEIGRKALERYSLDKEPSLWHEVWILSIMYAILIILAFISLFKAAKTRK